MRRRQAFGVTSSSSSSARKSSACSRREDDRRRQADGDVLGRGAHVGQLLGAADVDRQVALARVLADDHPLVDLGLRLDEGDAPLLGVGQAVAQGASRPRRRPAAPERDDWIGPCHGS